MFDSNSQASLLKLIVSRGYRAQGSDEAGLLRYLRGGWAKGNVSTVVRII